MPASGRIGDNITLTGTGFSATGNDIHFGGGYLNDLASDGSTITFSVPDGIGVCKSTQEVCLMLFMQVKPGEYNVSVINQGDQSSNSLLFTVVK